MTVVASNYARKENDLYQTEPWATEALLRHLNIRDLDPIWEPAAGNHLMADVLREKTGARVITSDIVTYDRQHDFILDFLETSLTGGPVTRIEPLVNSLITNPPYGKGNRIAAKFARAALNRCDGYVALLLTAKFDFGKTRTDLFAKNHRFIAKIALIDRIQWFPGKTSGTEDHAWYVWGPDDCATDEDLGKARLLYEGRP